MRVRAISAWLRDAELPGGGVRAAIVAIAVFGLSCTASGGGSGSGADGCPEFADQVVAAAGSSVGGTNDRSDLEAAWMTFVGDLLPTGVLDLCKTSPSAGLPVVPPSPAANGEVVRVRPVVPSPFDSEESIAAKVIYVTETESGQPAYAMTLMAVKASAVVGAQSPDQVVWAHSTAGIHRGCDQYLDTAFAAEHLVGFGQTTATELPALAGSILDAGHVFNAPYYVGLGPSWSGGPSPYLSRDTTGRTIIDAVRAVSTLTASTTWGLMGHSQGGHAALAASRLAPTYGSDTNLVGAAAVQPALNLEATFDYLLESVDTELTTGDPHPDDGAPAPASPEVITLAGHLLWGLRADFPALPVPSESMNPFFHFNARQSIVFNSLGTSDPRFAGLHNSGDPPEFDPLYGIVTFGPNAYPLVNLVPLATPSLNSLTNGYAGADWAYGSWSIPREDRSIVGCGYAPNAATGGVLHQYASNYIAGNMGYPPGVWSVGLPMVFTGDYTDPDSPVWDTARTVFRQQSLHDQNIAVPLLVGSGDMDSLFPSGPPGSTDPHTTRANVASMCAAGSDVELVTDPVATHAGPLTSLVNEALSWIDDRLAGQPVDPGDVCAGL